jgi:signal transduction histidine kinase
MPNEPQPASLSSPEATELEPRLADPAAEASSGEDAADPSADAAQSPSAADDAAESSKVSRQPPDYRYASRRLLAAIIVMLVLFVGSGIYTARQLTELRRYQVDVLSRNRRDTLQLLRIQHDVYALAISVRDMVSSQPRVPIPVWGSEFRRVRLDLNDALARERAVAPPQRTRERGRELSDSLQDFWAISDQVFQLARLGYNEQAAGVVRRELLPRRNDINDIVARWMADNDRQEQGVQASIDGIYARVLSDTVVLTIILVILSVVIAAWSLHANRVSFQRISSLARELDLRSHELRDMSWRVLDVQEQTLRQVSRDLHDEFGQSLTALGTGLTRVQARSAAQAASPAVAAAAAPPQAALSAEILGLRAMVQEMQKKIRSLSQLLRPTILDDFGIERTLAWYAAEFERQTGIAAGFQAEGQLPYISSEAAIQLYRIAQEAMTNIARHSGATRAWIRLAAVDRFLILEIRDNGRGLAEYRTGGVGLVSMKERAARLHGNLMVAPVGPQGQVAGGMPAPASGTLVRLEMPLEHMRSAATEP